MNIVQSQSSACSKCEISLNLKNENFTVGSWIVITEAVYMSVMLSVMLGVSLMEYIETIYTDSKPWHAKFS